MNSPIQVQVPADAAAAARMKPRNSRETDKQRNREIGHLLKAASLHRPMITRSVPHARGR